MALNFATYLQKTAHKFWMRRAASAVSRHRVRMMFVPTDADRSALIISAVAGVLLLVVMYALSWFMPKGQLTNSAIVGSRESGAIYVRVGETWYSALNLSSARLIAGTNAKVAFIPDKEIQKLPQGGQVGIPGAPNDLSVSTPATTTWSICDSVGSTGAGVTPVTTILDGKLELGDHARVLSGSASTLASYDDKVWLVREGKRSLIDLKDRRIGLALGIDPDAPAAPISRALYDALPPTAPLTAPTISDTGKRARYSPTGQELLIGSVVASATATGRSLYAVLPNGVQEISPTVAQVLRSTNSLGQSAPPDVSADVMSSLPTVHDLQVDAFPTDKVKLVDRTADQVACVRWERNSNDPAAQTGVIVGRRLPIADDDIKRVRRFVQADPKQTADQVYIGRDAANLIRVVGTDPASSGNESQWWVTGAGVRFGIPGTDQQARRALGVDAAEPTWAPWYIVRWLPTGGELSARAARTEHDTLPIDPAAGVLPAGQTGGN